MKMHFSVFQMVSFLQNLEVITALSHIGINLNDLNGLWDMENIPLNITEKISVYDAEQKINQEKALHSEEKFQYLRAWPIEQEAGQLLYILIRYFKPLSVLECGTSFAASTIFLAAALQKNQRGAIVTVEVSKLKHAIAEQNLIAAGVGDIVSRKEIAVDQYLKQVSAPFDFVFLDCDRSRYPSYFEALLPHLYPQAIIAVDNAIDFHADIKALITCFEKHGWKYSIVPIGDGLLVAQKLKTSS